MNSLEAARAQINEADAQLAKAFCQRMQACKDIAAYKKEHGLPIKDEKREAELITRNLELLEDEDLRGYYEKFLRSNIELSCQYQEDLMNPEVGQND